jgi:hypothetical protein
MASSSQSLQLGESIPSEVNGDDEEHLGRDVQADGVQPISWIETANGDIRGACPRQGLRVHGQPKGLLLASEMERQR